MTNFTKLILIIFLAISLNSGILLAQSNSNALTIRPILLKPSNNSKFLRIDGIKLLWFPNFSPRNFRLQVSVENKFDPLHVIIDTLVQDTSFNLKDLSFNTRYYWRVGIDSIIDSWSQIWNFITTSTPGKIFLISPQNDLRNRNTKEIFTWKKDSTAIGYFFRISQEPSFDSCLLKAIVNDTVFSVDNLIFGAKYYWKVKAFNINYMEGEWSDNSAFVVQLQRPNLEKPIYNIKNQDTSNLLYWNNIPFANTYRVQMALDTNFSISNLLLDKYFSTNTALVDSLKFNTLYFWRVLAFNINGDSSKWSNISLFRTKLSQPLQILPLNNSIHLILPIKFSWTRVDSAAMFRLQIASDSSFKLMDFDNYISNTFHETNLLFNGRKYFWRIKALNTHGDESDWTSTRILETIISTSNLIHPQNNYQNTDTSLLLKWQEVLTAKSYVLQVSENLDFGIITIDTLIKDVSFNLSNLQYAKKYFWRIKVLNSVGDSSFWSEVFHFKTKLTTPQLSNPSTGKINESVFNSLGWKNVPVADSYRLHISEDSIFNKLYLDIITKEIIEPVYLKFNTKYFWRISARNSDGDSSDWSPVKNFKTRLATPVLFSPSNKSIVDSGRARLIWLTVPGTNTYYLQVGIDSAFTIIYKEAFTELNHYNLENLDYEKKYYWRVQAKNVEQDTSDWSIPAYFKTSLSMATSPNVFIDTLNLSFGIPDSIRLLKISNFGPKEIIIDSILTSDGLLFSSSVSKLIIPSRTSINLQINLHLSKMKKGWNQGKIFLLRKNSLNGFDTLKTPLSVFIQKAEAEFSTNQVVFDTTSAVSIISQGLSIINFKGNLDLEINKLEFTGDTTAFRITNKSGMVKAGLSAFLQIEFQPVKIGMHSAHINFQTNSYPMKDFTINIFGVGKGGILSTQIISKLKSLADSSFEALSSNSRKMFFQNIGNEPLKIVIEFKNNFFTTGDTSEGIFYLKPSESKEVVLKYLIRNLKEQNLDTMIIKNYGFGEQEIIIPLKGKFDRNLSINKIKENLLINDSPFKSENNIFKERRNILLTLNPQLFKEIYNLELKVFYIKGGDANINLAKNPYGFYYLIPDTEVTNRGVTFWGQLYLKDIRNSVLDSIIVFNYIDPQISFTNYKPPEISIPHSNPLRAVEKPIANWVLFGFPFDNVPVDSVFKYFGGIKNMKDGEWIIYIFDSKYEQRYSIFDEKYFHSNNAYFTAQSLLDTFKISYTYTDELKSRKLSDTVLTFQGEGWKTISNPYTFPVQINSYAMLRRFDTVSKSFVMTNVMIPGEGYFVEPNVKSIILKTFGKYTLKSLPDIIENANWFLQLTVSDSQTTKKLYFSILNNGNSLSNNITDQKDFLEPPLLKTGLNSFIEGKNPEDHFSVSASEGIEGAVWNFVVEKVGSNGLVKIIPSITGELPKHFKYVLYNPSIQKIEEKEFTFKINENSRNDFKLLIGNENFLKETLNSLNINLVSDFHLWQNFPNPFNPITTISYAVPVSSLVTIKIFDVLGKEVIALINEEKTTGKYSVTFDAGKLASGIYFYTLRSGNFVETKKMVVLK